MYTHVYTRTHRHAYTQTHTRGITLVWLHIHTIELSSERTRRRYASHLRKRIIVIITIIIVANDDRPMNTQYCPHDRFDIPPYRTAIVRFEQARVASQNPDNPGDINA